MPTLQSYTQAPGPVTSVSLSFTAAELATLNSAVAALPAAHPAVPLLQSINTIAADPVAFSLLPAQAPPVTVAGAQAP